MVEQATLAWADLSPSTQAAFEYAIGARVVTPSPASGQVGVFTRERVSSSMLLVGIVHAHAKPDDDNPLRDLLAHHGRSLQDLNEAFLRDMPRRQTPFDPRSGRRESRKDFPEMTDNVRAALDAAGELATRVPSPPERLPIRFLFGGLFTREGSGAFRTLRAVLGDSVDMAAIAQQYPDFLARGPSATFERFLLERFPHLPARPSSWFAGNTSDSAKGRDRLGRETLVAQLARWLAAKNLQTPLAIGLFGDWGSGKSFFMRQLMETIDELSARSASAERDGDATSFCAHVRQVNFNAWFHSDSEIWPSLATQVFKAVSGVESDAPLDDVAAEELRRYWAKENPRYKSASQRLATAREQEERARSKVIQSEQKAEALQEKVTKSATENAGDLGKDVVAAVKGGEALSDAISRWGRAKRAWRTLPLGSKIALSIVALVTIVAAATVALRPSVAAVVTTAVGVVVTIAGLLGRAVTFMRQTFRDERNRRDLERQAQVAREQVQRAAAEQAAAGEELERLARLGLTSAYAIGQAELWAGREHLGVVSEIRRSFERLSAIITRSQKGPEEGAAPADDGVAPIDRIVVYIDDLDRCQPGLVVRVLEAIKLLMDLEHFVVIVGVDSRWLFRSLEIRFHELLATDGEASPEEDGEGSQTATPQNYLEKIFQFSLLLPPMTPEGFAALIDGMFERTEAGSTETPDETAPKVGPSSPADSSADVVTIPEVSDQPPVPGSAPHEVHGGPAPSVTEDLTPVDLVLTTEELKLLKELAPLIDTPRSAKRLTNVYRLLRVTEGEDRVLEGEAYRCILVLLGVIVGFPRQSGPVLRALMDEEGATTWETFANMLAPGPPTSESGPSRNVAVDEIPTGEISTWQRLSRELAKLGPPLGYDPTLEPWREWAPVVGAYTFHPWRGDTLEPDHREAPGRSPSQPGPSPSAS